MSCRTHLRGLMSPLGGLPIGRWGPSHGRSKEPGKMKGIVVAGFACNPLESPRRRVKHYARPTHFQAKERVNRCKPGVLVEAVREVYRGKCGAALELGNGDPLADNLGEAKDPLANQSDILFWLGAARSASVTRPAPGPPGPRSPRNDPEMGRGCRNAATRLRLARVTQRRVDARTENFAAAPLWRTRLVEALQSRYQLRGLLDHELVNTRFSRSFSSVGAGARHGMPEPADRAKA